MTFVQIQNRVMTRLNLTSDEARDRIKVEINDRLKEIQSSCNLAPTRRGNVDFVTASGSPYVTASGIAKLETLYDPFVLMSPLNEVAIPQIRAWNTPLTAEGPPTDYAVYRHVAEAITLLLYPVPAQTQTLKADALLKGTELVENNDAPTIPEDYQDALVLAVMADEYRKMEKSRPLADDFENRFKQRLAELRYFIAKSIYLQRSQTDVLGQLGMNARVWPYNILMQ